MKKITYVVLSLGSALALDTSAALMTVSGAHFDVQYESTQVPAEFGEPVIAFGNQIVFTPNDFRAESSFTNSDSLSRSIELTILPKLGRRITNVELREAGNYEIQNLVPGVSGSGEVTVDGELSLSYSAGSTYTFESAFAFNASTLTTGLEDWSGSAIVDGSVASLEDAGTFFAGFGAAEAPITLTITNAVSATTTGTYAASVQKLNIDNILTIETTRVPEPATVGLLSLALGLLRLRRRG